MAKPKLDAKVAQYVKESREAITELQKTAGDQASEIDTLKKEASDREGVLKEAAQRTADLLLEAGIISQQHHAKFASDLVDPVKAHNLLRNMGTKLAKAEAQAGAPVLGRPVNQKVAGDKEESESANDMFARRVKEAAGK